MSSVANGSNDTSSLAGSEASIPETSTFPEWINEKIFQGVLKSDIGEYSKILSFALGGAGNPGENFSSVLLRITIEVEISDDVPIKTISYILKSNHSNPSMSSFLDRLMLFPKEQEMYDSIIPNFESLFTEAGKTVTFAPKSFKFTKNPPVDYILLEDICKKSFRNANRIVGLDMVHMKQVLTKLAEFHAASACVHERSGNYADHFMFSIFTEKNRSILTELNRSDVFLASLKKWKNCEQYAAKLADSDTYLVDRIIQAAKHNPSEFNVLNHGDLWSNNIMFQYDAFGKIKETYFIDFQIGKYGSPAYDLYYLILTSAQMDIKLSQFDYMVKFYHDNLIENLKLLQYTRPLPKLKNLHMALLKNGLSAYSIVSKILPVVMLDASDLDKVDADDDAKLISVMYNNPKYVKAMEAIMPWLDNRGLLDLS